jgi:chorismate mutase
MTIRGIRGATTCLPNEESMLLATRELIEKICFCNPSLKSEDIASVFFTVTSDLQIGYPAKAARMMGWTQVPLMDAVEIDVSGGLSHCIRVLIHWNTDLAQSSIVHVYLHNASKLRPELTHD